VPAGVPEEITLCLFRVVQEALQNAVKHSAANRASVHLIAADQRELVLTIVDDGIGFNVDDSWASGLGLMSMSERVESVDGRLDIRSRPGYGTRLEVSVPLLPARLVNAAVTVPFH
jgi:signal transduction histidine kinase